MEQMGVIPHLEREGLVEVGPLVRSERYDRLVVSTPDRFHESVARSAALVHACESRDPAAAERAVQDSIRPAVDHVGPLLPSESEPS